VSFDSILFFVVAVCAAATGILMVLQRNPVMSAIYLIANFFCLALLYLFLQAQLLAVLQIVVYTGAIMVLVVFVIMLLNLGDEQRLKERFDIRKVAGIVVAVGLCAELIYIFGFSSGSSLPAEMHARAGTIGTVEEMGAALFSTFLFPFEMTSLLLLAAIIGAVVLAKRSS
jgi:NADH-quinone oxidoreductase subunit J